MEAVSPRDQRRPCVPSPQPRAAPSALLASAEYPSRELELHCSRKCSYKLFFHPSTYWIFHGTSSTFSGNPRWWGWGLRPSRKAKAPANPKTAGFYLIISAYTSQPLNTGKERGKKKSPANQKNTHIALLWRVITLNSVKPTCSS